jgi:PAS domain S-box-containing protein
VADARTVQVETGIAAPSRRFWARRQHRRAAASTAAEALGAILAEKPPRLFLRFAVWAGVAVALALVAGVLLARQNASHRAEQDVFAEAKWIADQLKKDDITKVALQHPAWGATRAELDALFGSNVLTPGIVRVNLFSRSGVVTYSTDHTLIGKKPYDLAQVKRALAGQTAHGIERLRGGIGDNPMVINSYVPVYWYFDKNSSPNGVVGVYRDYGPVSSAIRHDTILRAVTILAALMLLYVACFPILRNVTRKVVNRNRLIGEQAEALRSSEEQYRLIVETAAEGVALLDAEGRIVFTNGKLANILGADLVQLQGREMTDFLNARSRAEADPRWFRDEGGEPLELVMVRADGSGVIVRIVANPITGPDGAYSGALAMVTDITEEKRAQEALDDLEHRLAGSPAALVGRQAAEIARDFSLTVTEIAGYSDDLLTRLDANDPLHQEAEQLRRAADGAVALTRQLLAISRRESLQSGLIDLNDVLVEMQPNLPRLVGDRVQIRVGLTEGLGKVRTDAIQIEQVVVNLALNARQSMPEGGVLVIETANVDLDEEFARSHFPLRPGSYVRLAVRDNGRGYSAEQQERLFRPLFAGGSGDAGGLGLATVYGIVKQSGGFIWVDSEPGLGSLFTIYLPRVQPPAPVAA